MVGVKRSMHGSHIGLSIPNVCIYMLTFSENATASTYEKIY